MKQRVITAVLLLVVVIGALFFDPTGWAVKFLIILVAGIAGVELGNMTKSPFPNIVPGLLVGYMVLVWGSLPEPILPLIYAYLSMPLLLVSALKKWSYASLVFGTVWISSTSLTLYQLCSHKDPSFWPILMTAAIPIWCGDTAAIFVGKAFGKHKMAPTISPKKTWEGAIGNFLACMAAALVLGSIFKYPLLPMALLGANCGILGQAGDLFESWIKRNADMKDSGTILPGHGGVLDRIDSLIATAPLSLLIMMLLVVPGKP
ncbi:MAG TPA: phosphatidate cytidylyltransferase [Fimbriimonas sp.]|nr:phosphatidate cytidylyltransferase [Fimbriimonas sp.]